VHHSVFETMSASDGISQHRIEAASKRMKRTKSRHAKQAADVAASLLAPEGTHSFTTATETNESELETNSAQTPQGVDRYVDAEQSVSQYDLIAALDDDDMFGGLFIPQSTTTETPIKSSVRTKCEKHAKTVKTPKTKKKKSRKRRLDKETETAGEPFAEKRKRNSSIKKKNRKTKKNSSSSDIKKVTLDRTKRKKAKSSKRQSTKRSSAHIEEETDSSELSLLGRDQTEHQDYCDDNEELSDETHIETDVSTQERISNNENDEDEDASMDDHYDELSSFQRQQQTSGSSGSTGGRNHPSGSWEEATLQVQHAVSSSTYEKVVKVERAQQLESAQVALSKLNAGHQPSMPFATRTAPTPRNSDTPNVSIDRLTQVPHQHKHSNTLEQLDRAPAANSEERRVSVVPLPLSVAVAGTLVDFERKQWDEDRRRRERELKRMQQLEQARRRDDLEARRSSDSRSSSSSGASACQEHTQTGEEFTSTQSSRATTSRNGPSRATEALMAQHERERACEDHGRGESAATLPQQIYHTPIHRIMAWISECVPYWESDLTDVQVRAMRYEQVKRRDRDIASGRYAKQSDANDSDSSDDNDESLSPHVCTREHVRVMLCEHYGPFRPCANGEECIAKFNWDISLMEYLSPQQYEEVLRSGEPRVSPRGWCYICILSAINQAFLTQQNTQHICTTVHLPFYHVQDVIGEYNHSAMLPSIAPVFDEEAVHIPERVNAQQNTYGLTRPVRAFVVSEYMLVSNRHVPSVHSAAPPLRVRALHEADWVVHTVKRHAREPLNPVDPMTSAQRTVINNPDCGQLLLHFFSARTDESANLAAHRSVSRDATFGAARVRLQKAHVKNEPVQATQRRKKDGKLSEERSSQDSNDDEDVEAPHQEHYHSDDSDENHLSQSYADDADDAAAIGVSSDGDDDDLMEEVFTAELRKIERAEKRKHARKRSKTSTVQQPAPTQSTPLSIVHFWGFVNEHSLREAGYAPNGFVAMPFEHIFCKDLRQTADNLEDVLAGGRICVRDLVSAPQPPAHDNDDVIDGTSAAASVTAGSGSSSLGSELSLVLTVNVDLSLPLDFFRNQTKEPGVRDCRLLTALLVRDRVLRTLRLLYPASKTTAVDVDVLRLLDDMIEWQTGYMHFFRNCFGTFIETMAASIAPSTHPGVSTSLASTSSTGTFATVDDESDVYNESHDTPQPTRVRVRHDLLEHGKSICDAEVNQAKLDQLARRHMSTYTTARQYHFLECRTGVTLRHTPVLELTDIYTISRATSTTHHNDTEMFVNAYTDGALPRRNQLHITCTALHTDLAGEWLLCDFERARHWLRGALIDEDRLQRIEQLWFDCVGHAFVAESSAMQQFVHAMEMRERIDKFSILALAYMRIDYAYRMQDWHEKRLRPYDFAETAPETAPHNQKSPQGPDHNSDTEDEHEHQKGSTANDVDVDDSDTLPPSQDRDASNERMNASDLEHLRSSYASLREQCDAFARTLDDHSDSPSSSIPSTVAASTTAAAHSTGKVTQESILKNRLEKARTLYFRVLSSERERERRRALEQRCVYLWRLFAYTHLGLIQRILDLGLYEDRHLMQVVDRCTHTNLNFRTHYQETYPYDTATPHQGMLPDLSVLMSCAVFVNNKAVEQHAVDEVPHSFFKIVRKLMPRVCQVRTNDRTHINTTELNLSYRDLTVQSLELSLLGAYEHVRRGPSFMAALSAYKWLGTHLDDDEFLNWQAQHGQMLVCVMREMLVFQTALFTPYEQHILSVYPGYVQFKHSVHHSCNLIRQLHSAHVPSDQIEATLKLLSGASPLLHSSVSNAATSSSVGDNIITMDSEYTLREEDEENKENYIHRNTNKSVYERVQKPLQGGTSTFVPTNMSAAMETTGGDGDDDTNTNSLQNRSAQLVNTLLCNDEAEAYERVLFTERTLEQQSQQNRLEQLNGGDTTMGTSRRTLDLCIAALEAVRFRGTKVQVYHNTHTDQFRRLCAIMDMVNATRENDGERRLPLPRVLRTAILAYVRSLRPHSSVDLTVLYMFNFGISEYAYNANVRYETVHTVAEACRNTMKGLPPEMIWQQLNTIHGKDWEVVDAFFHMLVQHNSINVIRIDDRALRANCDALCRRYRVESLTELSPHAYCMCFSMCCNKRLTYTAQSTGYNFYGHLKPIVGMWERETVYCKDLQKKTNARKRRRKNTSYLSNIKKATSYEDGEQLATVLKKVATDNDCSGRDRRYAAQPRCGEEPLSLAVMPGNIVQYTELSSVASSLSTSTSSLPVTNSFAICNKCGAFSDFSTRMYGPNGFVCTICTVRSSRYDDSRDFDSPDCVRCGFIIIPSKLAEANRYTLLDDRATDGDHRFRLFFLCSSCSRLKNACFDTFPIFSVSDLLLAVHRKNCIRTQAFYDGVLEFSREHSRVILHNIDDL